MDAQTQWTGLDAGRLARIGDHLQRHYIDAGKIAGCQVAVSRHGHTAFAGTYGQMDLERGKPMAEDTIFRIYSMTKPITSIALMSLFERGAFQLDDPVARFFPEWSGHRVWVEGEGEAMKTEAAKRPISIRDVLTHQGGLTYGGGLPGIGAQHPIDQVYRSLKVGSVQSPDTLDQFMGKLAQVPLMFQPGERWMYSLSTDVCGALVERISGQSLDRFFQDNIFAPLGMVDTAFQVAPDKAGRFAANYQRTEDKRLKLIDDPAKSGFLKPQTFFSGGGGLTGTVADYMRFCEMLRRGGELDGNRIVGPRTLELMRKNHLAGGSDLMSLALGTFAETAYAGVGFGLGFAMTIDSVAAGSPSEGDFYWGGAASTIFWVDPREDLCVTFMTQLMPSSTFNFRGQLRSIIYSAITD